MGERHAPFGKVDLAVQFFHFLKHAGLNGAECVMGLLLGGFLGPAAPWAPIGRAPLFGWRGKFAQPVGGERYGGGAFLRRQTPERRQQAFTFGQRRNG